MRIIHKIKNLDAIKSRINFLREKIPNKTKNTFSKYFLPSIFPSTTEVQDCAIPLILNERSACIQSPTGTGKTIAYTMPYLKLLQNNTDTLLVVLPTKELAEQTYHTFIECIKYFDINKEFEFVEENKAKISLQTKQIRTTKFNVLLITKDINFDVQRISLTHKPRVIISTIGRLKIHFEKKSFDSSKIKYLVLDEFDKILSDGLEKDFLDIYKQLELKALHFFSATIIQNLIPVPIFCMENTKLINSNINLQFLFTNNKNLELKKLLEKYEFRKILIFCNTIKTSEEVSKFFKVEVFHSQVKNRVFNEFEGFLVCTDLLARGMDFKNVELVINYDFPNLKSDFVHRAGRTGRYGKGVCISLIDKFDLQKESFCEVTRDVKLPEDFYKSTKLAI